MKILVDQNISFRLVNRVADPSPGRVSQRVRRSMKKMKIDPNKFCLRIYDNYHFMDEEEAYNSGFFDTYEDAAVAAKARVDAALAYDLEFGIKPEELNPKYALALAKCIFDKEN